MKQKILKLCSIIATCFVFLFALTGCGDRAILNLEIKSGTFEYTYEQGDSVSFENLVVVVHYNDETSLEVKYGDEGLTVSTLSTEKVGKKDVEISYGGKSITVEVTVKSPSETTLLVRSIATLPAVENITTANRSAIVEMRTKYNSLSEDGKSKITNYSVLQAAEAKLAALDLAAHKENAKTQLNNYKSEASYSSTNWALVVAAKNEGITNVDAATTIEAVNTALTNAKAAMDSVDTLVIELAAAKTAAKAELNVYVQTDYSADNWNAVRGVQFEAIMAIDIANTVEAVSTVLANAKTSIAAIPTLVQEFETYKANKLHILETLLFVEDNHIVDSNGVRLYNDQNESVIFEALDLALENIEAASTKTEVDETYNAFITSYRNVKTKIITDVEEAIDALPATIVLENKAQVEAARRAYNYLSNDQKDKVSNYDKLLAAETVINALLSVDEVRSYYKNLLDTNYTNNEEKEANYNPDEWDDILEYVGEAKDAMDDATTGAEIMGIYEAAVASINSVKEKVVVEVENAIKALNKTITLADKDAVVVARNAYDALTGTQKDSISADVYAYLTNAETEIIRLEFEAHKAEALSILEAKLADCCPVENPKYNDTNCVIISDLIDAAIAKIGDPTQVTNKTEVDAVVQDTNEAIANVKIKLITDVEDLINVLPTLANGDLDVYAEAVETAREAYDDLTDGNKGLVSNLSTLVAAENDLAIKQLAQYKLDKIEELNAYLPEGRVEADYGPGKMETIVELRKTGINSINNAPNFESVDSALKSAKDDINEVKTQADDHYTVTMWSKPANISTFEDAKGISSDEAAGYLDTTSDTAYYVGDDNTFKFLPVIDAEAPSSTNSVRITEYRSKVVIKMSIDGGLNYPIILKDDLNPNNVKTEYNSKEYKLSDYVEYIGEYTFEFDFTSNAVGNFFEISVYPYYGTDELDAEENPVEGGDGIVDNGIANFEVTYSFKVVDGYNVTEAWQLGMMYNAVDAHETSSKYDSQEITPLNAWIKYLKNKGVERKDGNGNLIKVNGIVIHNKLDITKEDIPTEYRNGVYMHDYVAIYEHVVGDNETFDFYGNYFTIDASAVPIVDIYDTTDDKASHLALFKVWAGDLSCEDVVCYQNVAKSRTANFNNVTVNGNAKVSSNDTDKGMGALTMGKFIMITTNLTNVNVNSFMINLMPQDKEDSFGIVNINYVKSEGAFQNSLFVHGGSTVNITNSKFGQSGGPAIITSTPEGSNKLNGAPRINIKENNDIESLVTGNEAWFTLYPVEKMIAMMGLMENIIGELNTEKGIMTTDYKMNLIYAGIQIGETGQFGTFEGTFSAYLDESHTFDVNLYNSYILGTSKAPTMLDEVMMCKEEYGDVPIIVKGSNGGSMYLVPTDEEATSLVVAGGNPSSLAGSQYVTIYLSGFSIVLEYFN